MRFQEFNLTVEYYRVPYLVITDRPPPDAPKKVIGTIRIDRLHWYSSKWVGADVLVLSAGHWWNPEKTVKAYELKTHIQCIFNDYMCMYITINMYLLLFSWNRGHYFQEGEHVNVTMDAMEAFRRSLNTLKQWVTQNPELQKTNVFFRSYSPVHFRQRHINSV